jgi:hypothetical protein
MTSAETAGVTMTNVGSRAVTVAERYLPAITVRP